MVATRFAPVLGRLDPAHLATVRHVCLTMVANIIGSGRRPRSAGLTSVPDENGHLYAADMRDRVHEAMEAELVPFFETGAALVQSAPVVAEVVSGVRSAPVQPPADQYAWLFAGLDPQQLTATRDACWRMLQT